MVKLAKIARIDGIINNGIYCKKAKTMVKLAKTARIDGIIKNGI